MSQRPGAPGKIITERKTMTNNRETTRKSYRIEREFGLLVGAVILLFGLWRCYHGGMTTVTGVLVGAGAGLMLTGAIFPRLLVLPNRAWMGLAGIISMITTPIILGIIYFLVIMPIGLAKRMTGWDPLRRRAPSSGSYWVTYNDRQRDPKHFERMF